MGVMLAFVQSLGEPFPCHLSEYMRTIVYRVPGFIVREGRLSPIVVQDACDVRATIVTDPLSYLREDDFSEQYKLDVTFPDALRNKCSKDESSPDNDIFVVVQIKEDMCSFPAVDGQCIKREHDGRDVFLIVACDDAPTPNPDQKDDFVGKVLDAVREGLGVTGEFDGVFDERCYKADDGKCLYPLSVNIRANLTVLNPLTLDELTSRSVTVRTLASRIAEDIDESDLSGSGQGPVIVPKLFLSYSWDSDAHKQWVKQFAARLRKDGIDVTLDQWETALGDQLPSFMEEAIGESQYVLIVCTPNYKERSEGRKGGVGYEGDIMTAEIMAEKNHRKFIPVLRSGTWEEAAPNWLTGKSYSDLSDDESSEASYKQLVLNLHGRREPPPPIGDPMSTLE